MMLAAGLLQFRDEPVAMLLAQTYSFNKCSLNTYHRPSLVLGTWDRVGNISVLIVINFRGWRGR